MAGQKYKGLVKQHSLSGERSCEETYQGRAWLSELANVQPDADGNFPTSSIRAIKKDFVKEQRKQFEKAAGSSSPRQPFVSTVDLRPFVRSSEMKKCKSCLTLKEDSEKPGSGNEDNVDNIGKPSVRPKPEHLTLRRSTLKDCDLSEKANSEPAHSGVSQSPLVSSSLRVSEMKDNILLFNSGRDKELSPSTPFARANSSEKPDFLKPSPGKKELSDTLVAKLFFSPDADKTLSNSDREKSTDAKKSTANVNDFSPKEKNSYVKTAVDSFNRSPDGVKVILPPPKPPRILMEQKQSPVPYVHKERRTSKDNTYSQMTEAVSVVQVPERKEILNDAKAVSVVQVPERKEILSDAKPLSPGGTSNSPRNQEQSRSPKKLPVDRNKIDQWWENKFIRAPQPSAPRGKENLRMRRINNPCYMYAKVGQSDDVIRGRPLVRHHSDELLDSSLMFKKKVSLLRSQYNDGPIYHDPCDFIEQRQKIVESVLFDKDGYAVPTIMRDSDQKNGITGSSSPGNTGKLSVVPAVAARLEQRSYVKSKVSNAYAILRLPMFPGEQGLSGREDDGEVDLEEHKRLLRHVSSVKYKTNEAVTKYENARLAFTTRLFQYAMIIGLCEDASGDVQPKILFCFPKEVMEGETLTSSFCFPDASSLQRQKTFEGETFSFILTSATGDRRYGLCKRYLPPGSGSRFPEALCVVSAIGDPGFYGCLLEAAEEARFLSIDSAEELLRLAYAKPFPVPNHEVYLNTMGPNLKKRVLILKRMPDSRLRTVDFSLLLHHLSISTLIKVFGAVLLERKVIFYAKSLSTLSLCICALVALLYPFEWQHTFVTILPSMLTDVIYAPTPYILGLLSSAVPNVNEVITELNEVLVVDLDSGSLLRSEGDEARIIPKKLQKALTVALADDPDGQNLALGQKVRGVRDATVAEAFLRMFVETCSHYMQYVCCQQDGEIVFQRELFVKAVHSRSISLFLDWFTQTQMFAVFITERLKADTEQGFFEERIMEYRQEMEETTSALGNMKAIGKKIADFFRGSGDKIKKTFQKAVYV